jgi:(p)ppGpp synthase/HD superfamily hydrolase
MDGRSALYSLDLERALRFAARCHRHQLRKASDTPYVEHVMGVALLLDRLGFPEEVVIAGLLHDVVEDTDATLERLEAEFGAEVAETVRHCSEVKTDAAGKKRPWAERKRDHLAALEHAPVAARAIVLADKLHNLVSIELDLREGRPVWAAFNANRALVLDYYKQALDQLGTGDPRLVELAARGRRTLAAIEEFESGKSGKDSRLAR